MLAKMLLHLSFLMWLSPEAISPGQGRTLEIPTEDKDVLGSDKLQSIQVDIAKFPLTGTR